MRYPRTMLFLFSILVFISVDCQAQTTRRVPADHPTIQQAINASVGGDTVLVSPGTYFETINFLGKAITVRSESGPDVTIIDGNHAGTVVRFISGEGSTSVLDGFTIRNGFPSNSPGGGILCSATAPTIKNNIITNNAALFAGGGIFLSGNAPVIISNKILNNNACFGGGIATNGSSALIQGNTISGNTTTGCTGGGGGGIRIAGGSLARILDNIISNNSSGTGGGIELFGSGPTIIRGNTITGNISSAEGGGINLTNPSPATIVQNFITKNTASEGGGIAWSHLPNSIVNNTIADNDAPTRGSGILAEVGGTQIKIFNNIIVAKGAQTAVFCDLASPLVFNSNNVFSPQGLAFERECANQMGINGNISVDPLFVDPANGDYHLRPNSPSIDAGDNSAPDIPATDFDGDPRILDGDGDGTATIDMGADEVVPQESPFDICIDSGNNILRINSATGDYVFINCNGVTISGTGVLRFKGCTLTLQHNASDRRILAMVNTCQHKGTATVQILSPRMTFNLVDMNTNDSCECG